MDGVSLTFLAGILGIGLTVCDAIRKKCWRPSTSKVFDEVSQSFPEEVAPDGSKEQPHERCGQLCRGPRRGR
jgi:hypothetical protein